MTFTEAAAEVLRLVGRPLHYKEITAYAIEKSFLTHVGKSPEVTMGARLAALFKKPDGDNPMIRVRPGVFALKEWEEAGQLKDMVAKLKPTARTVTAPVELEEPPAQVAAAGATVDQSQDSATQSPAPSNGSDAVGTNAAGTASAANAAALVNGAGTATVDGAPVEVGDAPVDGADTTKPADGADGASAVQGVIGPIRRRTRIVHVKPEEETAGKPVNGGAITEAEAGSIAQAVPVDATASAITNVAANVAAKTDSEPPASGSSEEDFDDDGSLGAEGTERDGSRRRRRRRRRGSKGQENGTVAYSAAPVETGDLRAEPAAGERALGSTTAHHPLVIEVTSTASTPAGIEDVAGKDLADAIAAILAAADRSTGPQSLRQLAEASQRKSRASTDSQLLQSQIAAAVRADTVRRVAAGMRPRFRFAGGRIGLNDWLLSADLLRAEQEAVAAVECYREAARKSFVRKLQELPPHAFIELVLLVLERVGLRNVRVAKRAAAANHEAHFSGTLDTGAGQVNAALVVRRDGREIGRDRVAELRGALHHYGPAAMGWIVTAGSVPFGAREEAASGTSPIILYDGNGLAKLCEEFDVAVKRTTLPICVPDLDVLEALRSS